MNPYTPDELEKINKLRETNDKLEEFFQDKRTDWSKQLEPLFDVVRIEINSNSIKKITETQALCLSYRQVINEQISTFLDKRTKQETKIKRLKQEKFIFYATGYSVKTNMGEKTLLIDGHLSEEQRNISLIENYIEFLRTSSKNLESLTFTIKNIIELLNYLK